MFNQGDEGKSWYIILKGSVNVVIYGKVSNIWEPELCMYMDNKKKHTLGKGPVQSL